MVLKVRPAYDLKVMEFKLKCARRVESLDKSGKAKVFGRGGKVLLKANI